MNPLSKNDFLPHLSTMFEVLIPDQEPIPVTLNEIREHASGSTLSFSLMFTGNPDRVFRHNTYSLRHPALGEIPIFLGPIYTGTSDTQVVQYQAVFNTLKSEQA